MTGQMPSPPNQQFPRREEVLLLHEFFVHSVRLWGHRVAVDVPPGIGRPDRRLLTYAEVERQAAIVAGALSNRVSGECIVAILLPRDTGYIYSAQLAVLSAGAAFTCLDPSFPEERIQEILEDSEAAVLLTDSQGLERCRQAGLGTAHVLDIAAMIERTHGPVEPLPHPDWLTGSSLAYVIYTSGSTGRPKGVMIEHRSIANLIISDFEEFRLSPEARVGQGSSPAYDSAIEETWLALSVGATLVVMDDDTARLGPDLIAWLHRERVTVLCPPPTLLRTTDCADPESALRHLSLLYVGGEALPSDLADSWSKGRQMVNGYGPTECTVTSLRGAVLGGSPVTIGRPIAGIQAWVLDEGLQEVPAGSWGELCLGGIGLARGYWKNPELTASRFISHPQLGRIYRTGDVVHRGLDGSYFYHGRQDSQVKIRGYRLELEEVESQLTKCAGVRSAVCAVQSDGGQPLLVAFVVPEDPEALPALEHLKSTLLSLLPSYMVPARFGLLAEIPTTVGGKTDRKSLPHLSGGESRPNRDVTAPRDPVEIQLEGAFRAVLGSNESISVDDDFFADLGGDSLRAAQLVSLLRRDKTMQGITVRDLYERRTVAELARHMRAGRVEPAAAREGHHRPASRTATATIVQAAWLLASSSLIAVLVYLVFFEGMPWLTRSLGLIPFILLFPLIVYAALTLYTPFAVLVAVAVKRCLIGRYRPLRAPVWGSFYVRNWIVQQTVRRIPWRLLSGTVFQLMTLRALGARIGRRVHIHRGVNFLQGGWDLLEIGDNVTIGQDAFIRLVELDDGDVVVGPVSLAEGATLDTRAGVAGNTRLEPGAYLSPLSSLRSGGVIPKYERWDGIPARPAGQAPCAPEVPAGRGTLPAVQHGVLMGLARLCIGWFPLLAVQLLAIFCAAQYGLDADRILDWLYVPEFDWVALLLFIIAIAPAMAISLGFGALAARMLGRVPEGVISIWSLSYIRVWLKAELVDSAGEWLSGTLFWPVWLRAAGMKIGAGCEISTVIDVVPELVEIGKESFFADGIYLGGPRLHRGTATLAATRISPSTFIGNHAVIPAGQQLPENILLGICTVADDTTVRPGSSWFGHPCFELPNREVVASERRLTYEPSWIRYLNRLLWEMLRLVLPAVPLMVAVIWIKALAASDGDLTDPMFLFATVPLLSLAAAVLPCFLVLSLKWLLLGRVRPGQHPLWSCWCSRWDFLYVAWRFLAVPFLTALEGTQLLIGFLRAMGAKLGKRVVLGSGFAQVVDPDMMNIEDEATVHAMFQAHTFEDRILKIDHVFVRS
ncbi:MAG: amino acid adenylation domain-containing protein, partial [Planctomycetes bacterium]|nr:amino acid adenylation domain-containing protein [Planctomycetota bacterium]